MSGVRSGSAEARRSASAKRPRRRLAALALAGAALLALSGGAGTRAGAADSNGQFEVFGSGRLTCERWLADRRLGNASSQQSEMWVAGYLTAYNFYVYRDYDITERFDGEYLLEWIDDYCRERSPNLVVVAAHELVQMLRRRR